MGSGAVSRGGPHRAGPARTGGERGGEGNDPFEVARRRMVEEQLLARGIRDRRVLDAMARVPRHDFVDAALLPRAYGDHALPTAEGQTISQPWIVARMLELLAIEPGHRVLEIGTGSGYLTALLAHRTAQVYSVEIRPALAAFGKANIARHGLDNVTLEVGDGMSGLALGFPVPGSSCRGPFDIVVLTGSVPLPPRALLESLAPGGRAFAVVGEVPVMTAKIFTRDAAGALRTIELFETLLAPLANCERPSRFTF